VTLVEGRGPRSNRTAAVYPPCARPFTETIARPFLPYRDSRFLSKERWPRGEPHPQQRLQPQQRDVVAGRAIDLHKCLARDLRFVAA